MELPRSIVILYISWCNAIPEWNDTLPGLKAEGICGLSEALMGDSNGG
jgi:hypothetical protein